MDRSAKTAVGVVLMIAGAALAFVALAHGGITWPALIAVCVLLALGGHLVSYSQMQELVGHAAQLIRAWRGRGE